ncbi:MAG: DNA polymerase III subunit alpha [Planctomycetes bacterium]|nr:DNA polymerase III subunit alpha [Planctomycetota bacterium]
MTPLHTHSSFSLCRGVSPPAEIVRAAKAAGLAAVALTDRDGLYGLPEFLNACEEHGVRPIIGAEIAVGRERAVLLAQNAAGYATLCRTITARHQDPGFRLARELAREREGLFVLSDSVDVLTPLLAGGAENLFVEVRATAPHAAASALTLGLPAVATPDAWFVEKSGWEVHRLLRAIANNATFSSLPPGDIVSPEAWLKPEAAIRKLVAHVPGAIENAERIADACRFTPDRSLIFPQYPDTDPEALLERETWDGARRRYGEITETIRLRVERELKLIREKHFTDYFLIVRDIAKRAPRICGRGSAAASVVAYCLGITQVDPIEHNLFFERFLNEGRVDPPDIDIDFAWDERDDVIESVLRDWNVKAVASGERPAASENRAVPGRSPLAARHSPLAAAMICNHVLFRPRMAIRETAKVFGIPEAEIAKVTSRMPWFWDEGGLDDIAEHPMFKGWKPREPWPEIFRLAKRLLGLPRLLSVHPGGIVLAPGELSSRVPCQTAAKGVPIVHWEKDGAEEMGLVKIDLLGNRSLAVIRDAIRAAKENYGIVVDPPGWKPHLDPATIDLVRDGNTMGVFYVESPAMRQLQQKTRVGDFEHLVIHSSIIRPAANKFIREYIRRLRGGSWEPLHPVLGELLAETYGIMSYQEDVSKVAMALAGFDAADADGLRKVLAKKERAKKLEDYRRRFYAGAESRGVDRACIDRIWEMIGSFAGYSFCKPHSASYALVSYESAYLKAHFPAEFIAAVISNQGGFYSTFAYVSEARRMGLRVLPPHVNASRREWTGVHDTLRAGLMQVKSLHADAVAAVLEARTRGGPFRSFEDFQQRARLDAADTRLLIRAGALDSLAGGLSRAALLWRSAAPRPATGDLFAPDTSSLPRPPPYTEPQMLAQEVETLDFLMSKHPLAMYDRELAGLDYVKGCDLAAHAEKTVTMIGWWITGKVVETKAGAPMEFVSFEDTSAIYETTFFPEAYAKFCQRLTHTKPFVLKGKVELDFDVPSLVVEDCRWLEKPSGAQPAEAPQERRRESRATSMRPE